MIENQVENLELINKVWSFVAPESRPEPIARKQSVYQFIRSNIHLFDARQQEPKNGGDGDDWIEKWDRKYSPVHFWVSDTNSSIGILQIQGIIGYSVNACNFSEAYEKCKESNVSTLIIKVNSPGGSSLLADSMTNSIAKLRTKNKIKLIGQCMDYAASAGYQILTPCNKIYASESTCTGSIGSVLYQMDYSKALESAGIKEYVFKSGEYKDEGNPNRPMTSSEKQRAQERVNQASSKFFNFVSKFRKIELSVIQGWGGQVMYPEQALENKLIDGISNFDVTLSKLENKEEVELVEEPESKPLYLFQDNPSNLLVETKETDIHNNLESVSLNIRDQSQSLNANSNMETKELLDKLQSLSAQVSSLTIEKKDLETKIDTLKSEVSNLNRENEAAKAYFTDKTLNAIQKATGKTVDPEKAKDIKSRTLSFVMQEMDLWNSVAESKIQSVSKAQVSENTNGFTSNHQGSLVNETKGKLDEQTVNAYADIFASSVMAKPGVTVDKLKTLINH